MNLLLWSMFYWSHKMLWHSLLHSKPKVKAKNPLCHKDSTLEYCSARLPQCRIAICRAAWHPAPLEAGWLLIPMYILQKCRKWEHCHYQERGCSEKCMDLNCTYIKKRPVALQNHRICSQLDTGITIICFLSVVLPPPVPCIVHAYVAWHAGGKQTSLGGHLQDS